MAVERGFRRLIMLISIALLVLGIAADAVLGLPHWVVHVTLRDGREVTFHVQWTRDAVENRKYLAAEVEKMLVKRVELPNGEVRQFPDTMSEAAIEALLRKEFPPGAPSAWPKPTLRIRRRADGVVFKGPSGATIPEGYEAVSVVSSDIASLDLRRDWSWSDVQLTSAALGLVALLWLGFFAIRWVAHGFARQERT